MCLAKYISPEKRYGLYVPIASKVGIHSSAAMARISDT
jgi:hypothetical protein